MNWTEYFYEFIGTAIHLFVGLTGIYLVSLLTTTAVAQYFIIGVFFALGLLAVVYSPLGKRSGGHINPAVSTAFWLNGLMSGMDTIAYIIAQFGGAVFGAWAAFALFNWPDPMTTLTLPGMDYPLLLVLVVETVITLALILTIFSFVSSNQSGKLTGIAAAGYIILTTVLFAAISGASMNPARTFGTAAVLLQFRFILIYFVASMLGAYGAYMLFRKGAGGAKPTCSKLCHKTKGPCLFKCECEFSRNCELPPAAKKWPF